MEKFDKLLQDLNSKEIKAECVGGWEDNIPTEIYDEHFGDYKHIKEIEVENDKWCRIVTSVIEIHGRYLGITHVGDIHNNNTDISDCLKNLEFREVKKKNTTTFE